MENGKDNRIVYFNIMQTGALCVELDGHKIESMSEDEIGNLALETAQDQIFGFEADFGKPLMFINLERQKENWNVKEYLKNDDLEKANALNAYNLLIGKQFIGLKSNPPMNLQVYRNLPELCFTIFPMTPYILVRSIRYFIDINPHYSFSCIRKSNHKHKDLLIALLYEILLEQSRTAFDLLEYQKLCSFIRERKKQNSLSLEEVNAAEKAKSIIIKLKSFIEKMVVLIAAAYSNDAVDSKKNIGIELIL